MWLKVNEIKSVVVSVFGCKFLGYSLWVVFGGVIKCKVVVRVLLVFKCCICELIGCSGGCSMKDVVEWLWFYVLGWKVYF